MLVLIDGMSITQYTAFHKERLHVAQILIEDEIGRLSVWQNPLGDAGRAHTTGPDRSSVSVSAAQHSLLDSENVSVSSPHQESWPRIIQMAWSLNPAVAVHMAERLKYPAIITEVTKLVRARPKDVIDVPEALAFLLGDRIEPSARHSLQVKTTEEPFAGCC
jgi:phosphatidylinositol 4-kinase A